MLSPDKRQQIEREGEREIRRFHREVQPTTFASIIDDIRHKVVEEGWYGRQVTGNIAQARDSDDFSLEHGTEIVEHKAVYGEPPTGWVAEATAPDRAGQREVDAVKAVQRNGPEVGM